IEDQKVEFSVGGALYGQPAIAEDNSGIPAAFGHEMEKASIARQLFDCLVEFIECPGFAGASVTGKSARAQTHHADVASWVRGHRSEDLAGGAVGLIIGERLQPARGIGEG